VTGAAGLYALADRQLIQTAPDSALTAYRGIYAGATFEYAPARPIAISQYYEARVYGIGLLPTRPTDLASFVYNHQTFSHYLADQLNPLAATAAAQGVDVPFARRGSNAYTVSYLAHLFPGVYASAGIGYTDHPSALYFQKEGGSLNLLAGLLTVY
jgi:porin